MNNLMSKKENKWANDSPVYLKSISDPTELDCLVSLLEEAGIPYLKDEKASGPESSVKFGAFIKFGAADITPQIDYMIYVPSKNLEEAEKIVDSIENAEYVDCEHDFSDKEGFFKEEEKPPFEKDVKYVNKLLLGLLIIWLMVMLFRFFR